MRQYDIIKVFCKALGLYFATQAFVNAKDITYYLVVTEFYDNESTRLYYFIGGQFIHLLFNIIAAWVLIKKADFVTGRIMTDTNDKLELNVKKTDLIELVIIGISGLLIIESTPELINKLVNYVYLNPYDRAEKNEFWTSDTKANILYSVFKLAVGLVTIANSRLISRRLTKIGDKDELIENENK
jgi:hypothetical protein